MLPITFIYFALDLLVVVLLLSVSLHIEGAAPPLLEAAYCSQRRDQLFGVAQVLIRSTAVAEAVEAVEATLKVFVNLCPVLYKFLTWSFLDKNF